MNTCSSHRYVNRAGSSTGLTAAVCITGAFRLTWTGDNRVQRPVLATRADACDDSQGLQEARDFCNTRVVANPKRWAVVSGAGSRAVLEWFGSPVAAIEHAQRLDALGRYPVRAFEDGARFALYSSG